MSIQSLPPVNATGAVPIPGFRLDRPYPGDWSEPTTSDPSSRWTLRMNVTTDDSFTGITVALNPPPPGNEGALFGGSNSSVWQVPENITDSWRLVIYRFDWQEMKTVRELNDREDGGCPFSVISEACQKDLRNRTHTLPSGVYNVDRPGSGFLSPVENSDACEADGWTKGTYTNVPLNQNYTRKTRWAFSSDHPYREVGSRTFPLMLIWAKEVPKNYTADFNSIGFQDFPKIEDSHISFACVRADTLGDENQNGSLPYEEGDVVEFDGADEPSGDTAENGAVVVAKLSGVLLWAMAFVTMGLTL